MNNIISFILIVLISVAGISIVLVAGMPLIDSMQKSSELQDAKRFMGDLDAAIRDVSAEGSGSTRIIRSSDGHYAVYSSDNSIEYSQDASAEASRKYDGNLLTINGNDVDCYESDINSDGNTELVMENSLLRAAFSKVNSSYDNSGNIILMTSKTTNIVIRPSNSSIVIDSDSATSSGAGYSEILRIGADMPSCTVHFFMNSTVDYDTYYTLYSGADFIVIRVENIT